MTLPRSTIATAVVGMALLGLAGCSSGHSTTPVIANPVNQTGTVAMADDPTLALGGARQDQKNEQGATSLGVNAYLWRGALDTLSFMPLASADPFGGVIITDWYQPPDTPGERFKATAYILSRELRADGVRIAIFRQTLQNGQWVDADLAPQTVSDIENKVLARARELRSQNAG